MDVFAANLHPVVVNLLAHHHHGHKFHIGSLTVGKITPLEGEIAIVVIVVLILIGIYKAVTN